MIIKIVKSIKKKILKEIVSYVPWYRLRRRILHWCGYEIGEDCYIPISFKISDLVGRSKNVTIGDRVSMGPNVYFITDSSPNKSKLVKIFPMVSADVIIEDDVWIGANVIILPGVTIGKCSIIGAGSVVNKNISEYSIAVGVPAKINNSIDPNSLV